MWIIGDEFVSDTYTQFFKNAFGDEGQIGYIRAHYDVTAFCLGKDKLNKNILSRFRNALVKAVNKQVVLPKAIIYIMEQEFIDDLQHYGPGISHLLGKCVEYIANQTHRVITAHKEKLPSKSRKFKYPAILWATMPEHYDWKEMNQYRNKYNVIIQTTTSLFREMEILKLTWDDCDRGYFTRMKLNARGRTSFWISVNEAFEAWDKLQMKLAKIPSCGNASTTNKKWKKVTSHYREDVSHSKKFAWKPAQTRFKLPKV